MFEVEAPDREALHHADDETVAAAIEEWNRIEAVASARRLHAIAELTSRRCDKEYERAAWACDGWDSAAAEVAAALRVSHKKASSQMSLSLTLRHQLPKVAALYLEGKVSYRVISAISWHTHLVDDDEPLAQIDAALAHSARKSGATCRTTSSPSRSTTGWIDMTLTRFAVSVQVPAPATCMSARKTTSRRPQLCGGGCTRLMPRC